MDIGLGVLLAHALNNTSKFNLEDVKGKRIREVKLVDIEDGSLVITFSDESVLTLRDDGRSCCESRYLTCDDNLGDFVGSVLMNIDVLAGGYTQEEYGDVHEIEFLVITTNIGRFTVEAHNEHNGYYGGLYIVADYKVKKDV
jgi:hypothetical protein